MALHKYDWILGLITIAFCVSAFGNGANDVANSYATSVAARTLTMPQVGVLSIITEFVGAVAMGSRVTDTIKNGIIDIDRFEGRPGVLMLAMGCAEFGSAGWLFIATRLGFPVSTTQTIVGAFVGVGFASQASITWAWEDGSVSQTAASWGIAPLIAAGFSAIIYLILKYSVLEQKDSMKWAMRLIPVYLSFTAAILALFIVIEAPTAPSLEEFGAGKTCGIIFGVLGGSLVVSYVFFLPYFKRRLLKNDARLRFYHIPLGPLLNKEDPWLYFPGDPSGPAVKDYYENAYKDDTKQQAQVLPQSVMSTPDTLGPGDVEKGLESKLAPLEPHQRPTGIIEPEDRWIRPFKNLPIYHPRRIWGFIKFFFLQGVSRDCVSHNSAHVLDAHSRAKHYDNRVEHLWTYAQVASAMMMSIAHGSNDVSNAVGPWAATYSTWKEARVNTEADTPVFILVVAGLLLGIGFWFFGFHIIRSLGNKVTQLSPTRGFCMELGAAITVLLASRLGLPVSTTQCLTGALLGVALMNYDLKAVNWRQMAFIFGGWVLTLPCAGLIAGILMIMALNTPHF
jgi:sodium-dependent phosphate transporter